MQVVPGTVLPRTLFTLLCSTVGMLLYNDSVSFREFLIRQCSEIQIAGSTVLPRTSFTLLYSTVGMFCIPILLRFANFLSQSRRF